MKRVFIGLVVTLFAWPAVAQQDKPEPWYEVEIILFEHLNLTALESETWPLEIIEPDLNDTVKLIARQPAEETSADEAADTALPYLILPPEQYQLTKAYKKLAKSDDYLPYVHIAWRQIIPPRDTPDRIFIHDQLNDVVDEQLDPDAAEPLSMDAPPVITDPISEDPFIDTLLDFTPPAHTLSGTLSIGIGRYLHVNADLLLYKPQVANTLEEEQGFADNLAELELPGSFGDDNQTEPTGEAEDAQPPELFRIQRTLRMRSGEVHYLDHPLAGMLILFTPYTPPEPEPADELDANELGIQERVDINQSTMTPSPQ